jgi:hypothetical protein
VSNAAIGGIASILLSRQWEKMKLGIRREMSCSGVLTLDLITQLIDIEEVAHRLGDN